MCFALRQIQAAFGPGRDIERAIAEPRWKRPDEDCTGSMTAPRRSSCSGRR